MLLPVYKILTASSATDDAFPSEVKSYFDMFDFIAAHLSALEPTVRSSGDNVTPNVYCGIITVLLLPLYMMSKRIAWKEKLSHFILLILLFVCFNCNYTNFIWHGFHFPNDLPYRFSFMYSFILLICAFKVFRHIKDFDYKTLIILGGTFALVCAIVQKYDIQYTDDTTIYVSLAFVIVYTIIICAAIAGKLSKVMISAVLCCAVICEVLICDVPKFEFGVRKSDYISDYTAYRKAIESIEKEDDGFYRTELNDIPSELRMSPCWYNYEGINCFSSMANKDYASMQHALGNFSNDINSFMYHNQTPIYNLMFNVKYVIDNNNPMKLNEAHYRYLRGSAESLTTYRSQYPSSIAFCADRAVLKGWHTDELLNCFELQSNFLNMASGVDKAMFEKVKIFTNGAQNCSITSFENEGDGSMSFSVFNSEDTANFDTRFTAEEKGNYYIYWGATNKFAKSEIQTDSYSKTQEIGSNPYLLDLGVLEKGEEVKIKTYIDEDVAEGSGYLWAYRIDDAAFREAYGILADDGMMQVTEHSDRRIKGTVTAEKNEILYTSIAYDTGWKCFVDGTQVKPYELNNALLALEIGEGTHTVEFRYTPAGLHTGLVISALSIGAILLFFLFKKLLILLIARALDNVLAPENS